MKYYTSYSMCTNFKKSGKTLRKYWASSPASPRDEGLTATDVYIRIHEHILRHIQQDERT